MATNISATDLLIAPPSIPDPRFKNSVIMMTHNNQTGSFGLCVNKPMNYTLDEILEDSNLKIPNLPPLPIFWGGPVSPNSLWMLHSTDWVCKHSVMITSVWAMTSHEEMFHNLSDGDMPRWSRIIMGYSSWGPGQLDAELEGWGPWKKDHSWLVAQNLGPEWLFDQDPDDLWSSVVTLSSHQAVDSWL